jgi:uncharacterized membrane protein
MSKRSAKRDKVLGKAAKPTASKWIIPLAIGLLAFVGAAVIYSQKSTPSATNVGAQTGAVKYASSGRVEQIPITTASLAGGNVTLPLAEVKEKKLVGFTYNGKQQLPLLAYISPSGKVVTAVSLCEPCNSTTFHIEGDQLVCNTCGTRWSLEGLKGISGGCTLYPPDAFTNSLNGDKVVIPEANVQSWKRRV